MTVVTPTIFGTHQENTLVQLADVATRAERVALMADGHLGYIMPIGGVAAYKDKVSVTGVGFDIACGNAAIKTNRFAWEYKRDELELLADYIQSSIAFGVGRKNNSTDSPDEHPLFNAPEWGALHQAAGRHEHDKLMAKARKQLGTVGSGNHYVDVFADEEARIWVGVHFGSRGFGHTIASGFLALHQGGQWGKKVPEAEALLDTGSGLGADYWTLMNLAGVYAYAGREWVARRVVSMIGGTELEIVHNHHNFAWEERHDNEKFIVVRKGATPAFPGQKGFVGGSMGDNSVILYGTVTGPDGDEIRALQRSALYSTVHGAGRVMSRTQAAGKRDWKTKEIKTPGLISQQMLEDWLGPLGVILRGGGLDEAPQAYRRLPDVLAAQGDTIRVQHTLTPLIVVMAGANEFDPYKD
jgi:tRNA-splicing ligase RtcB